MQHWSRCARMQHEIDTSALGSKATFAADCTKVRFGPFSPIPYYMSISFVAAKNNFCL
jgi:hypothetical protein